MSRRVVIEFLGKDKNLGSTVNDVEGKTSKLGDKLKSFGKVAAAGLAVAGIAAGKFALDAIGSASDLNETVNKSRVIFGKFSKDMESWAGGAAKTMGLSKQAALDAAAGFGDMFSQIGFAGRESARMSKDIVQLSADLGSFNNLPTAEVADMMSAAFRGEFDSLQRVIPNINAARVQTEALTMTGKKSAEALTAQEKAAATLAIVQKDGARAAGDFERTSGSLANQQKILGAQFENVKAKIGTALLPIATKAMTFFSSTAMPVISRLGSSLAKNLGPAIEKVGHWIMKNLVPAIQKAAKDVMPALKDAIGEVKKGFKQAQPFFELLGKFFVKVLIPVVGKVVKHVLPVLARQVSLTFKIVGKATELLIAGWNKVKAAGSALVGWVKAIPGKIRALGGAFRDVGRALIDRFVDGIKNAAGIIGGIAGNVWSTVKRMLNGAIDKINAALEFTISLPGPDVHINPPNIPNMASGGIIKARPGGKVIRVAEAGRDEAVIPLDRRGAALGGTTNVYITVQSFDPRESGKLVEQALIKWQRATGQRLAVKTL